MRLLPRREIDKKKAAERKREIDEGARLAQRIDTLRKTSVEEDVRLRDAATRALESMGSEFREKTRELHDLSEEIVRKREEKMLLETPVDLSVAWEDVRKGKEGNALQRQYLMDREVNVIYRESKLETLLRDLATRDNRLKGRESMITRYEEAAKQKYDDSEEQMRIVESERNAFKSDQEKIMHTLSLKESDLARRIHSVELQSEQNEKDKSFIAQEKAHISSQQKALKVSWDLIRKLQ